MESMVCIGYVLLRVCLVLIQGEDGVFCRWCELIIVLICALMIRQGFVVLYPIKSSHLSNNPLDVGRVVFQLFIEESLDTESEANASVA